jgi:hypothetical protein
MVETFFVEVEMSAKTPALNISTIIPRRKRAMPAEQVFLANLLKAREALEKNFLDFARLLSQAYHSGDGGRGEAIWVKLGHRNFEEFVVHVVGWAYRRAYSFVALIDCLDYYGIPEADALEIGSSKMALIAAHTWRHTLPREEVMACVQMAKETPWGEFSEWISVRKSIGTTRPLGWLKMKLETRELDDVFRIINRAREVAGELEGVGPEDVSPEHALVLILREWAESRGLGETKQLT